MVFILYQTINPFPKKPLLGIFMCLQYKTFENTVKNSKIAQYEQFLLFPLFSTTL